jgi:hypothetical protein
VTTHTTTTGDHQPEVPHPIDRVGQRVLVEAVVLYLPWSDEDGPKHRHYTVDVTCGPGRRELVSIDEGTVRDVVRRIPEPPQPTRTMPARDLAGAQVEVLGKWYTVLSVTPIGVSVTLDIGSVWVRIIVGADDHVPCRLAEETQP